MSHPIAVCYHPTTVVFIDDNPSFLDSIHHNLDEEINHYQYFSDPIKALSFLQKKSNFDPFTKRCTEYPEEDTRDKRQINYDLWAVHQEIYRAKRFDQISVIVVDYAMPVMDGAQLARALADFPYKIILLTGEASHDKAIELFNEGRIQFYIRKDDPNILEFLTTNIKKLQQDYFIELSKPLCDIIIDKANFQEELLPSCLGDLTFVNFFNQFIANNNICEYYLFDEFGSFLLMNADGKMSWLIVMNEGQMQASDEMFKEGGCDRRPYLTPKIGNAILNRDILIYYFNDGYSIENSLDWQRVIYSTSSLTGKNNYYYSYIKAPLTTPNVNINRVVSFQSYLRHIQN